MLDFPNSPTLNQIFQRWRWNGRSWVSNVSGGGGGGGANVMVQASPPPAPAVGDLWWRNTDGQLFVWYDDGNSQQWVIANRGLGGGIDDAPTDGELYGRRDAAWEAIPADGGGGGISGVKVAGIEFRGQSGNIFNTTAGLAEADDGSGVITMLAQSNLNAATLLDAGSLAANTWYYCFTIDNDNFNAPRLLLSLSPTAPTMPGGYSKKRRVFCLRTSATSIIVPMIQRGDQFLYDTPIREAEGAPVNDLAFFITLSIPNVFVTVMFAWVTSGTPAAVRISSPLQADVPATGANGIYDISQAGSVPFSIWTNDRRIRVRFNMATPMGYLIFTHGWIDPRGQYGDP